MVLNNATNNNIFAIVSPSINFKTVAVNSFFTTVAGSKFAPIFYTLICDTATSANGDAGFNIGWTGPNYDDYQSAATFLPSTADHTVWITQGINSYPTIPASTAVKINVFGGDSGTAITGRVVLYGIYYV